MANVPKAITDLPVASAMGDDDLLVVSQNATTSSIKGELIKGYAQNAVASQVTAAQTAANQAGQSATRAEAARQGAAAAQTAAESAQDAAETARDQSVAAAGTIGDSVEQAQDAASQASSAKDAAVAAQTAAETAKTAAETASGQAKTAATQAAGSATAAQTAATQAGDAKTDAETARNEAETSASSASNSASDAESAATEAEQAKTYIENMDMEGETLPAGSSVTVTKTTSPEGDLLFLIGVPQGIQGDVGPTGASVDRIERTSGTGAPGTTDTYTVYLTDGKAGGTFQVYNGSNGTGSGDFMADGSVPMTGDLQMGGHKITDLAEPTDNTDAASKEYVDDTITVSLVGNYIPTGQKGQANGVASLDGSGKVPNEQLPPMDYVPTSRTVNGHALSADVTLDADDVGAIPNPSGGTAGQVLTKTANGSAWESAPSGLPDGGTEGQMLYKSADGAAWGDKPVMIVTVTETNGTYSADKTYGEINQAINDGFAVFARYYDLYIPYFGHNIDNTIIFFSCSTNKPDATSELNSWYLQCVSIVFRGGINEGVVSVTINNLPGVNFALNTSPSSLTLGEVLLKIDTQLSTKLTTPTGTAGQLLGFTADNKVGAVDAPESGLTQEQADERYLQLTGGTMTGPIYLNAVDSPKSILSIRGIPNAQSIVRVQTNRGATLFYFQSVNPLLYGSIVIVPESNNPDGPCRVANVATPISDTDVANKAYVDSKAPTSVTVTLFSSSWSNNTQTVTVSGVSATETAQLITPTPAIASQSAYYEAGIMCTGQAANSLTFTCQTVPTSNLTVYVVIQPLN